MYIALNVAARLGSIVNVLPGHPLGTIFHAFACSSAV
jgi:hypothetical protein